MTFDRILAWTVVSLRTVTLLALVGCLAYGVLTPGPRAAMSEVLDRFSRAEDEPMAQTLEALGGSAGSESLARGGDKHAACEIAVARVLGMRCGRPVSRRHAAGFPARVATCQTAWPAELIACLASGDAAQSHASCAERLPGWVPCRD